METRLNILHLIETGGPGGAETVFRNLVTGLPPDRWRSVPVIPVVGWLHESLLQAGVRPIVLDGDRENTTRLLLRLRALLSRCNIDLVHAHLLGSAVYASLAAFSTRIPVVCTFHGLPDIEQSGVLLGIKLRVISRSRNRIVFVSNALRDSVLSNHSLPERRVRVVHNGIDLKTPTLTGTERAELGATTDEFLVGAVGNLRPAKDYGTLLKATAIARKSGCPIRTVIVGEGHGELQDELIRLRSALGLDEIVSFTGFRSDVPRLLSALDAFVLSSSTEGFSLSTVEALWLGKPVVVTRSGGPEEIVRHEITGLLVPARDPGALADGILRLYRNPRLAKAMGARGTHDVRPRFSMARMIRAYEGVYEEALRHPGP